MNAHEEDRLKQLLKQAMPPVDEAAEPARDLWPAVLRRLDARSAAATPGTIRQNWFDLALVVGSRRFRPGFPGHDPVFLYYF